MRAWIAAVAAVVLILPVEAQTAPRTGSKNNRNPTQLHWSELAAVIAGQKVSVGAAEGPRVEGRVIALEPDALRLQIKKGETRIPRESITTLELLGLRKTGRTIGTVVLGGVGLVGGAVLTTDMCDCYGGIVVGAVAGGIALSVAGYYLGKRVDRKKTRIIILPDTP